MVSKFTSFGDSGQDPDTTLLGDRPLQFFRSQGAASPLCGIGPRANIPGQVVLSPFAHVEQWLLTSLILQTVPDCSEQQVPFRFKFWCFGDIFISQYNGNTRGAPPNCGVGSRIIPGRVVVPSDILALIATPRQRFWQHSTAWTEPWHSIWGGRPDWTSQHWFAQSGQYRWPSRIFISDKFLVFATTQQLSDFTGEYNTGAGSLPSAGPWCPIDHGFLDCGTTLLEQGHFFNVFAVAFATFILFSFWLLGSFLGFPLLLDKIALEWHPEPFLADRRQNRHKANLGSIVFCTATEIAGFHQRAPWQHWWQAWSQVQASAFDLFSVSTQLFLDG